ncbi:FG-GAP repeat protein [Polystyrenella longa]|uniref:FG-GAP repeat protein n=1 Tax=Polystyrenella longa TaxID=2528007 RepID=A0A518CJ90_9PLAN|nr:VCBS repeat-containing protein [Polystyrenella longa]QDU79296.1 FG-GAP repeat protein [Polystyrenella longa]
MRILHHFLSLTLFNKSRNRPSFAPRDVRKSRLNQLDILETRQMLSGVSSLALGAAAAAAGTGNFEESAESFADTQQSKLAVLEDFNGDGHVDVFLAGAGTAADVNVIDLENELWLNQGDGTFLKQSSPSGAFRIDSVVAANLDGDSDVDLLVASTDGETNRVSIWWNDGNGTFSEEVLDDSEELLLVTAVADVDGDADQDVVLVLRDEPTPQVYKNDGAGNFSLGEAFVIQGDNRGNDLIKDINFGDVDGDGDLDAIITYNYLRTSFHDATILVFINDGNGVLDDRRPSFSAYDSHSTELGDVDGDGDLDIVVVGLDLGEYSNSRILFNNGQGIFTEGHQWLRSAANANLADIDADGDLDLLFAIDVTSETPDEWKHNLYLNDGSGFFSPSPEIFGTTIPGEEAHHAFVATGDLDGDGSVDVLLGQIEANDQVWFNTNKVRLPYRHNFEMSRPAFQGLELNRESTTSIQQSGMNRSLRFDNSGLTGLTTATVETVSALPAEFNFSAELTSVAGSNRWYDGFLIFDYKSETNFKYAGLFAGQNQWVIGHYQGDFSNRLAQVDWDDVGRSINTNEAYLLEVAISGNDVQLWVDGENILEATFGGVFNTGSVGLASYNAVTLFDDIQLVSENTLLPIHETFEYGEKTSLHYNKPNGTDLVFRNGNSYLKLDVSGRNELAVAVSMSAEELPEVYEIKSTVQSIAGPNRWYDGFVVFDYKSETDFKYAGMFVGQNEWSIGHYQGNWNNRIANVDWDDTGRSINPGTDYELNIQIVDSTVQLKVNGEFIAEGTFTNWHGDGSVGMASYKAETWFKEFHVAETLTPFPAHYERFDDRTLQYLYIDRDRAAGFGSEGTFSNPGNTYLEMEDSSATLSNYFTVDVSSQLNPSYEVSVEMSFTGTFNSRIFGSSLILFDFMNEQNYKVAGFHDGQFVISEVVNSSIHELELTTGAFVEYTRMDRTLLRNTPYTMHLDVVGNRATFSLDGEVLVSYEFDEMLKDGKVGIVTDDGMFAVDNFVVGDHAPLGGPSKLGYLEDFYYPDEVYTFTYSEEATVSYVNNGLFDRTKLQIDSTEGNGVGFAIQETHSPLANVFDVITEVQAVSGTDRWIDGFVIFDYQSETDFKYAGMFAGQNTWVVGHYQGDWSNRLLEVDWSLEGRAITTDIDYLLHVSVDGSAVTLHVDGELIGTANFSASVHAGQVGLAVANGVTLFDNFSLFNEIQRGRAADFPYVRNLDSFVDQRLRAFRYNDLMIEVNDPAERLAAVVLPLDEPLPETFVIKSEGLIGYPVPITLQNSFIIFDYKSPSDYKYAGADYGAKLWSVGHHLNGNDHAVSTAPMTDTQYYQLASSTQKFELHVDGDQVMFKWDRAFEISGNFDASVNQGQVGIATIMNRYHYRNQTMSQTLSNMPFALLESESTPAGTDLVFADSQIQDEILT